MIPNKYRYYLPKRFPETKFPPFRRVVIDVEEFDEPRYVAEIDRMAHGWVEYETPLTPAEVSDCDLISAPREVE